MSDKCGKFSMHLESIEPDGDGHYTDIIARVRCKAWDCPECRKIKGRWLQDQIHNIFADSDLHMLTLTYNQNAPMITVWKNLGRTWNRLLTYIRKQNPGLKFIRIVEPHKSGYPHLHVLISQYINLTTCLKYLTKQGFGWNCNLKKIGIDSARNYVAKYLTKQVWSDLANDMRKKSKSRIVSASHGIQLTPESDHTFRSVEPKINDPAIYDYVSNLFTHRVSHGCYPAGIYIGYRFMRFTWSYISTPSDAIIANQLVLQQLQNIDEYF